MKSKRGLVPTVTRGSREVRLQFEWLEFARLLYRDGLATTDERDLFDDACSALLTAVKLLEKLAGWWEHGILEKAQ